MEEKVIYLKRPLAATFGELLQMALDDVKAVVKSGNVKFNMNTWHTPFKTKNTCQVCLAGAVIHRATNATVRDLVYYDSIAVDDNNPRNCFERHLTALDAVRIGTTKSALATFYSTKYGAEHTRAHNIINSVSAPCLTPIMKSSLNKPEVRRRFYKEMRELISWCNEHKL